MILHYAVFVDTMQHLNVNGVRVYFVVIHVKITNFVMIAMITNFVMMGTIIKKIYIYVYTYSIIKKCIYIHFKAFFYYRVFLNPMLIVQSNVNYKKKSTLFKIKINIFKTDSKTVSGQMRSRVQAKKK